MDQILFYKEGQSLKASMEQVRLSYTRPYTMTFVTDYDQISSFLGATSASLLYYLVNDLQEADRIRLRYIQIHAPQIRVCLCAPAQYALDAWSLGVFHFEAQPVYSVGVEEAYRKYIVQQGGASTELTLKQDDGIRKIPFHTMLYLQAAGNYTSIHLSSGKMLLQTRQLGTFLFLTEQDMNIQRVHRSLILNLKKVKSLKDNKLYFYDSEHTLEVGSPLALRIKQLLLGTPS